MGLSQAVQTLTYIAQKKYGGETGIRTRGGVLTTPQPLSRRPLSTTQPSLRTLDIVILPYTSVDCNKIHKVKVEKFLSR